MVDKILDVFSNTKNYDIALMTTFNFDVSFFERSILNRLYENNVKKVSLFVDSYELNKALSEIDYTSIGKKYIINPIEMKEAFHPKLILLLGQASAKLVVASANITVSGYLRNGEIFNVFDYDDKHPENLKVINSAISFFEQLNDRSFNQDKALFNEIKDLVYYGKTSDNSELHLIYNLEESILTQVEQIVGNVTEIDIAVPYYDNYAFALKALHTSFPNAKINLYLQNKKCKFPLEHKNDDFIASIIAFDKCNDSSAFYHGKVFRFITTDATYFLYGSANCTKSALTKATKENGNVECCVLEKGTADDFDAFFDNFNITEDTENLQCDLLTFDSESNSNFFYRYGALTSVLVFNIGFVKRISTIEVFYGDTKLGCEYKDDSLVVSAPTDIFLATDLITLTIKYDGKQEQIKCWYTDITTLNFNRAKTSDEALFTATLYNEDDEKYLEDVKVIMEAMSLSFDDALKERLLIEKMKKSQKSADDEDYDDDEGVISYVIPDASEIAQYRKYEYIDKHFKMTCFLSFNELFNLHISEKRHIDGDTVWYKGEIKEREPRSSEYRFKNFVKARVRQMLNPEFISYVPFDHYVFCVNTVLSVFDKYSLKEYVKDMFDYEYLIKTRLSFMEALLSKEIPSDVSEEVKNTFLILVCQMILESNKQIYRCDMDESSMVYRHKSILKELNNRFGFRSIMVDYIGAAIDKINETYYLYRSYTDAVKDVDAIFGYAKKDELEKIIFESYGLDSKVEMNQDEIIISVETDSIKDFMVPKENVVAELKKYYINSNEGRFLKIEIKNIAQIPENSGYAYIITEELDFKRLTRTQKIVRKNGVVDKPTRSKV